MYSIRLFADGVESNLLLGNEYQVFDLNKSPEAFKNQFFDIYQENFDRNKHQTRCIVIGDRISCFGSRRPCLHSISNRANIFNN